MVPLIISSYFEEVYAAPYRYPIGRQVCASRSRRTSTRRRCSICEGTGRVAVAGHEDVTTYCPASGTTFTRGVRQPHCSSGKVWEQRGASTSIFARSRWDRSPSSPAGSRRLEACARKLASVGERLARGTTVPHRRRGAGLRRPAGRNQQVGLRGGGVNGSIHPPIIPAPARSGCHRLWSRPE